MRVFVWALAIFLAGCSADRGGIVDRVMDKELYTADTKAERLLRLFEVQALIVRFVAETGGSSSDRNAIAMANIAATDQLNMLATCLQYGSSPLTTPGKLPTDRALPVRGVTAYCSFYESRLLLYEEALFAMLRQAARDDPEFKIIEQALTGDVVGNFSSIIGTFVQIAGRIIRDEMVLRSFKADALELEYFVWQQGIRDPSQIQANCSQNPNGQCESRDSHARPERETIAQLKAQIDSDNAGNGRPTIYIWHFQEVASFMHTACLSLNSNSQVISGQDKTRCDANLPFLPPSASTGPVKAAAN